MALVIKMFCVGYARRQKKINGIWISELTDLSAFEMDELYWFIYKRKGCEKGVNTYVMLLISRYPRQILGVAVESAKTSEYFQGLVDNAPFAKIYHTDGEPGYCAVIFPGKHGRNIHDKSETHFVESINSDLRHYISGLRRCSKVFFRKLETKRSVLLVFVDAFNKFGDKKAKTRVPVVHKSSNPSKHLHKWRYPTYSLLDYLQTTT